MPKVKKKKPIKYYSAKRRAIYSHGDEINCMVLFDLCGWTCFVCKQAIDPRRRCPDWQAATIEHIVPLAHGGTHTWDNIYASHYKCNMDKGSLLLEGPDATLGK